jgi:hypothetical protein
MKPIALDSLAPDLAIHRTPQALHNPPVAHHGQTPAQILRRNFNRTPLRCDEGEVRQDFAGIQAHAQVCRAALR